MLLVLIMIQIVISVIWCLIETPKVVIEWANPSSMDPGCEKCNVDEIARFSSQAYNFVLITFTTYFAIRTRDLSCGSKWIFRAMISNWIVGFIFAAVHYTNLKNYAVARVALCFATSLSAYLYLFLYFGPKVYIILFKPEKNIECDDMEELDHSDDERSRSSINDEKDNLMDKTSTNQLTHIKEEECEKDMEEVDKKSNKEGDDITVPKASAEVLEQILSPDEIFVHSPK